MEQKQNQARLDDKVIANIKTLFDLKEQGILTEDEFTKAKAKGTSKGFLCIYYTVECYISMTLIQSKRKFKKCLKGY